jgi:hypothetical protein
MDNSAIIIVIFYDISFFIKFLGVFLVYKIDSDARWTVIVTYVAIGVIWMLLYYFIFEMRKVYI